MKTKLTYLILATVMMSSLINAQSFNLLTASSSDKVAQTKYFTVSSQQISLFASTSMQQPSQVTTANEIIAERTAKSTSVVKGNNNLNSFSLEQNYPNPFNGSTVIRYSLQSASNVSIIVYDMTGREVVTLVNENLSEGQHFVTFSNQTIASGTYFYRLVSIDNSGSVNTITKKMIVMK